MKVVIAYPPICNEKGYPTLGQNRQFQFFKEPTYIYPVVPATAATMLKDAGHEVVWLDCIAEGIDYENFIRIIKQEKPDIIAIETKTPVVKQHWKIINDIKQLSTINYQPSTVLFGDHVTALPEESFENSPVDFVLTGGDYDFLLLNLCDFLDPRPKTQDPKPKLEPGIYYRDNGQIKNTGKFQLNHDLNTLPFIDRDLTKWQLYAHKNGNFKRKPGTYIMSGRDCWWGKCSFCSWPTLYPKFRNRSVDNVLDEIGILIDKYAVREIMDDTGSISAGDWLRDFCQGMIQRGYHKKVYFDCNMRFGVLSAQDLALMKKANFRLILLGLESANQKTLDTVNKNISVQKIIENCKQAKKSGLYPHITMMFGYPWESYADARNTLRLGRWLLKKGYAYTMQSTLIVPYPGTILFDECKRNGLLKTLDWNDYDMKQPVMRSSITDEEIMALIQAMYRVSFDPEFILRKVFSLRDMDDVRYLAVAAKKVFGHIFDFKGGIAPRKRCATLT